MNTDSLRDKLIQKGWVTNFNADTLVKLIEEHYAALAEDAPPPNDLSHLSDDEFQALCPQGYHGVGDESNCSPQPIPVSERLPGPEPCWWFTPEGDEEYGWWVLEPDGMERHPQPTHWLPFNALPLPSGEVEE